MEPATVESEEVALPDRVSVPLRPEQAQWLLRAVDALGQEHFASVVRRGFQLVGEEIKDPFPVRLQLL